MEIICRCVSVICKQLCIISEALSENVTHDQELPQLESNEVVEEKVTLESCYSQNNFQKTYFFYVSKPTTLLETVIGSEIFLKNFIWICSLQLYQNSTASRVFTLEFSENFHNSFSTENPSRDASKIDWLSVKKIIQRSFCMIYDKQWNSHLYLFG